MDVILSAAFGIEANSQENPNSPVVTVASKAVTRSPLRGIMIMFLSILPFGIKIMEMFPGIVLSNSFPLIKIAEEIVSTKRAGTENSSRKVSKINDNNNNNNNNNNNINNNNNNNK